jgi:hypothetical protein
MPRVSERERTREELKAAILARTELGTELEPQVIEGFVDRIEQRLEELRREAKLARKGQKDRSDFSLALAIVSLGVSIPLTAIAGGTVGLAGILVVWLGIVLVNFAYARRG